MTIKKKDDAHYINAVKQLGAFAPSLKKYKRRKKLNRWEKAAISRKVNYFEKNIQSAEILHPLSAAQAKALSDKTPIVGGGFRAVKLRNTNKDATIRIVNGRLRVRSSGRTFNYVSVSPVEVDAFISAAESIMNGNKRPTIYLWFRQGRATGGSKIPQEIFQSIVNFFQQYKHSGEFILGLAYLA